jgi:polyhydroxybutyrate depolymerase
MMRFYRFLKLTLLSLIGLIACLALLFGYFVYTPEPDPPVLQGKLSEGVIEVDGLKRSYLSYVPARLAKGAPLVLVMHGSGESARQIRSGTGYGFERLANEHGFAVVYPDSSTFDWNDCIRVGDFSVNGRPVDDVGFLNALVDKLIGQIGVDSRRVFATGVSSGGFMSIRLALEAPTRFRAVAAVAANVPVKENFKCTPAGQGTSVMIMNGTRDTLVPFDGGEVDLFGLFFKGGKVRSSQQSAQYFASYNDLKGAPETRRKSVADGFSVEQFVWRNDGPVEVELVAIHGAGHGIAQPYKRHPRLLGPSPKEPNGPAMIWAFFDRQRP